MLDSSKPRTTTRVYLVIPDAWDAKSIKCLTNNLKQDKTTSVTTLGPCALNTLNAKLWKRSLRRIVSKFFLSLDDSRTNLVEYLWNTQTIKRNLNIYSQLATTALRASAARSGSERDIIAIMYRSEPPKKVDSNKNKLHESMKSPKCFISQGGYYSYYV